MRKMIFIKVDILWHEDVIFVEKEQCLVMLLPEKVKQRRRVV